MKRSSGSARAGAAASSRIGFRGLRRRPERRGATRARSAPDPRPCLLLVEDQLLFRLRGVAGAFHQAGKLLPVFGREVGPPGFRDAGLLQHDQTSALPVGTESRERLAVVRVGRRKRLRLAVRDQGARRFPGLRVAEVAGRHRLLQDPRLLDVQSLLLDCERLSELAQRVHHSEVALLEIQLPGPAEVGAPLRVARRREGRNRQPDDEWPAHDFLLRLPADLNDRTPTAQFLPGAVPGSAPPGCPERSEAPRPAATRPPREAAGSAPWWDTAGCPWLSMPERRRRVCRTHR